MTFPAPGSRVLFSGVAGSGMSALAVLFAARGYEVSGSDRALDEDASHPIRPVLSSAGVRIVPQDGSGVPGSAAVVASTAVEEGRPDMQAALCEGIPVLLRPRVLGRLVDTSRSVAVAGTSGKSTTTGMLAFILRELGSDPCFVGGGRVKSFVSPSNPGNVLAGASDLLVAEACEADAAIADYRPAMTVIANLALDHRPVGETGDLFCSLAGGTRGAVIVNADDTALSSLRLGATVSYGIDQEANYRGTGLSFEGVCSRFLCNGQPFEIRLPGRHNVENALAAIAVLGEMGIPLARVAGPLGEFDGIVGRFDVKRNDRDALIVHDYAHNPHKISALMNAVQTTSGGRSVAYVFQPHGFGPTRLMGDGYRQAFRQGIRKGDHVFVLPIFDAGGTANRDVSSDELVQGLGPEVEAVGSREELMDRLGEWPVWVVLGARDESLGRLAEDIAARKGV